jgi:hypothetical protein
MAKKSANTNNMRKARKLQREALETLREEVADLHEISLIVMADRGILPPLYGGEYLGDNREVIPLWGWTDEDGDDPHLGAVLLRVVPEVEPNDDLRFIRDELEMTNDYPIAELLDALAALEGTKSVMGAESLRELSMFIMLSGQQVSAASGYDYDDMIDHILDMKPFAVFLIVPTEGEGDNLTYRWDDLEKFRAEVIYAESPQMLETAIWEYRLKLAIDDEKQEIVAAGSEPRDELIALNVPELVGMYDLLVMNAYRLYGTTSALQNKQQELDILREENGDLVVKAPLKPEIEPIPALADARGELNGNDDGVILHLDAESPMMRRVWYRVRPSNLYAIRLRHGALSTDKEGRIVVSGFTSAPVMEWMLAETLPELYRTVHLATLYEMLTVLGEVDGKLMKINEPES